MPTQINERPTQPGTHPSVQPVQQPIPPWLQRDDDDLDLAQLLQILRRRSLIITGVAITVASVFWAWTLTRTPIYRGSFRVLIESVDESNPSQDLLLSEQGALSQTVDYDTQIEVLLSSVLLQPISQELQEKYPNLTVDQIAEGLAINRLRETKVLEVSYRGAEPQKIQDILDEVAQQYLEYSFEQRQASLNQGIQFVDDQLPELRERVNNLEVRLERFRQQYSLLDPENRGDDLSELISRVEGERQQLQTELSQARSLYRSLQSQLSVSPEEALAAAALSESPRYQALLNQIQELEAQIAVESAKYQPDSPQLAVLRERRDNLEPMLEAEATDILGDRFAVGPGGRVDGNLTPTAIDLGRQLINAANDVQMLQARSQTLAQVEQSLKQEFALVPSLARQYTDLQRELEIATESLNRFLTTRETLQIDAAQKSIPWQLIAEPRTSRIPISPNIPRNLLLGIVSGLVLGGAAALLVEKLDQVYHSPDELKSSTHLPLLGIIPFHPNLQELQNQKQAAQNSNQNGGVSRHDTLQQPTPPTRAGSGSRRTTFQSSMFFEAFRSLYTNIRFLGSDTPIRSLVISSAIPSEGKSTISLYLARAAAVMGQRVLLVDADLRSPKHHIFLGLPNIRGVSNLVSESLQVRDVVQRSPLDENLSVITAGPVPPDPVKLLSSRRMQSLMEQFEQEYDFVVYDMPPILGFSDSSIVAAHTDGMILVVGLGKTERSAINRAIDEVKLSPASILGVVANGIKSYTTRVYGYHRYYRYYPKHDQAEASIAGMLQAQPGQANAPVPPESAPIPPGDYSESPSPPPSPYPSFNEETNEELREEVHEETGIGAHNPFDFRFDESTAEEDTASDINTQYQMVDSPYAYEVPGDAMVGSDAQGVDEEEHERTDQDIPIQDAPVETYPIQDIPIEEHPVRAHSDESYPIHDAPLDISWDDESAALEQEGRVRGWQYDASESTPTTASPSPENDAFENGAFKNGASVPLSDNPQAGNADIERSSTKHTDRDSLATESIRGGSAPHRHPPRRSSLSPSWLNGVAPSPTPSNTAPSTPKSSPVTMHSSGIPGIAKVVMGLGIAVVFGALGWSLYQRFANHPPLPPNVSVETPIPPVQEDTAGEDTPDANAPDASSPATEPDPQSNGADEVPVVPDPETPDIEPSFPSDAISGVITPETTISDTVPPDSTMIETAPSDTETPELAPEVQDPFAEAVRLAQEAVAAGETANTPEEWSRIAEQWQRASALMAIVPQSDERFAIARDRTVLYRNNGEFARQKVLELLSTKDFSPAN